MLFRSDARATALTQNFAGQWLQLRLLGVLEPDRQKFPEFDGALRDAMRGETEHFFEHIVKQDRPVTDFLSADYTFVNERLATHYGLDGVNGSRFRRVKLPNHNQRGGPLAQGTILVTTSYPDRTSPVLRGKWLLNNVFGLAVPAPPPGVNATPEAPPGKIPPGIQIGRAHV